MGPLSLPLPNEGSTSAKKKKKPQKSCPQILTIGRKERADSTNSSSKTKGMFQVGPNQRMEGVAAMRIGKFLLPVKSSAWLLGGEDSFIFSLPLLLSLLSSHLAGSVCASGAGGGQANACTPGNHHHRMEEPSASAITATHPSFDLPGHDAVVFLQRELTILGGGERHTPRKC